MTESAPMTLLREPAATATAFDGKVVVSLYPHGFAHGGTGLMAELSHARAVALYAELGSAIVKATQQKPIA